MRWEKGEKRKGKNGKLKEAEAEAVFYLVRLWDARWVVLPRLPLS